MIRIAPSVSHFFLADAPDFEHRGVMLDISRDKVPTLKTLRRLIDGFAALRFNQVQLYMEHTFAYRRHRTAWRGWSPLTAKQVRALDDYCRERGIELVPNQNSFGHMERWLTHRRYAPLAEARGPYKLPWGEIRTQPTTLNPRDPRSLRLMASCYEELLPCFSSRLFNVGCDEPFELGQGRSRAACRRRGLATIYLDYLLRLHRLVRRHGRRMMIWADVVAAHPEIARRLPRDVILLEWGYESDHPFEERCSAYRRAGFDFYVCPGTSSWRSFAGRPTNAFANLRAAAEAGRRHGALGYLITDWGDVGHHQYLPVSYAPWLYGAAVAWNGANVRRLDQTRISRLTSEIFFGDPTGKAAEPWLQLGRVHELSGVRLKNKTALFRCMSARLGDPMAIDRLTPRAITAMLRRLRRIRRTIPKNYRRLIAEPAAADELDATLRLLAHACRRAALMRAMQRGRDVRSEASALAADMRGIIERHRRLWLARNRPGGLRDSLAYYRRALTEYEQASKRPAVRRKVSSGSRR